MDTVRLSSRDAILIRHYLIEYRSQLCAKLLIVFDFDVYTEKILIDDLLKRKFNGK